MTQWFSTLLFATAACGLACAQDKTAAPKIVEGDPFANVPWDVVSYSVGRNLGKNLADLGVAPDVAAYLAGIQCGFDGSKAKYSEAELDEAVKKFKAALPSDAELKRRKAIKDGKAYLEKNGQRKEVTTTASGLQYEVLRAAEGPKPLATDTVKVHYHGTLVDGTVFDSSIQRKTPISFPLNQVIPGWTEGVMLMSKGSKYKFAIPDKLAYGAQGQGAVGPNNTLIFEVELLDINPPEAAPKPEPPAEASPPPSEPAK